MKVFFEIIFLYALLVWTMPVAGKDRDGNFTVKGVGVLDCNAYLSAANTGGQELAQYAGYLTGYISAYNEHVPDTFDLLPWQTVETLMKLMLRRCTQVPSANFGAAVTEMANYFSDRKLTAMSGRVRIGTSELVVYPPVLADIKAALARRGYSTEDLETSLIQFQRDENLSQSDGISQQVLLRLLYGRSGDKASRGQPE